MSNGRNRSDIAKAAKTRNLLWTLPAILFFIIGLGFLAIFAINYVRSLLDGGHYLLLVISSTASPFLTLGIFSLMLGGIFKTIAYLGSLHYLKLHERQPVVPLTQENIAPQPQPKPAPAPAPPVHENPLPEEPADSGGPHPDDL